MQNTTAQQIEQWLLSRNISREVLIKSKIKWNGFMIEIPIFDINGIFLYNKYRKNPLKDEPGPKYKYDRGGFSTLYNVNTINGVKGQTIFITEGELDCLVLNSFGFYAVSSTGGCATFKQEWSSYLYDNQIYIVYDRDDAGILGAIKLNQILPNAKIVLLPNTIKGKDITDFFKTQTVKDFIELVNNAESWLLPYDPISLPQTKKGIETRLKELIALDEKFRDKIRELNGKGKETRHIDFLLNMVNNRIDYWNKQKNIPKSNTVYSNNSIDLENAKKRPISDYLQFNPNGFCCCLFHQESTPSMKWYKDTNTTYCFGCNARKDVIDIVQKLYNLNFKDAVNFILNKH